MKNFYTQSNIGKAKYLVNHHDGSSTHRDGSPFYDVTIFKNKQKRDKHIASLREAGYVEK